MELIKQNYKNLLKQNNIRFIKTSNNKHTSKYQIAVYINNQKEYNKVQSIISKMLLDNPNCAKKGRNLLECKVRKNSKWYVYGQRSGKYNILHPEKFDKPGYYLLRHGTNERLFSSPRVSTKQLYINTVNKFGRNNSKKQRQSQSGGKTKRQNGGKTKSRWDHGKKVECKVPKQYTSTKYLWTSEEECKDRKFTKKNKYCKEKCLKKIKNKSCFQPWKYCCVSAPGC
jgi:hypothetical protein